MDYEKKYKEALDWMKDVYPTLKGAAKEDAEYYFPELKESEDERIRKAIKKALQVRCDGSRIISDEPVTLEEALAWLEKQCESDDISGRYKNNYGKNYVEQKPAWSEEDEKIIRDIHCFLDYRTNCYLHDQETKERAKKIVSWLDELKNRVLLQPKQEWSEEDIEILETCISLMSYNDAAKEETDWLKSLRERYTWKPSDEQMEYLSAAIEESNENPVLDSLYQDLKKL